VKDIPCYKSNTGGKAKKEKGAWGKGEVMEGKERRGQEQTEFDGVVG